MTESPAVFRNVRYEERLTVLAGLVAQASVNLLDLMRRHKELVAMHVELCRRHSDLCGIVAGLDARLTAACEPSVPELPGRRASSRFH